MIEPVHRQYVDDERRLLDAFSDELWSAALPNAVVDIAPGVIEGLTWHGVPVDAPAGWEHRSTAMSAMALRTTRVVAVTVRAGYSAESWGSLRRLSEAFGHAARVARDATGQYAENWLNHRGKARGPRATFGASTDDDAFWNMASGLAHASAMQFMNLNSELQTDGRLVHRVGPRRLLDMDEAALLLAARQLSCARSPPC